MAAHLRQLNQTADDRFVGLIDDMVIHDLLNPMTAVLGQLELLQDHLDTALSERDRKRLDECMVSAGDLAEMLVNLRSLCQLQSSTTPLRITSISAQDALNAVRTDNPWAHGCAVEIISAIDPSLYVRDHGGLVVRAIHVLAQSAMRLCPSGKVQLRAESLPPQMVRMTCEYAGATLNSELSRNLFTPQIALLQREHGLRLDRARGMELVSRVVRLLEGSASYEPTGDGGRFIIDLPKTDAPESSTRARH